MHRSSGRQVIFHEDPWPVLQPVAIAQVYTQSLFELDLLPPGHSA